MFSSAICCLGKAISITDLCACARVGACVSVGSRARAHCLAYLARSAHAPYCIVICGVFASTIFSILLHKRQDFRKKKVLYIKHVS
jgi:hypothetical protein